MKNPFAIDWSDVGDYISADIVGLWHGFGFSPKTKAGIYRLARDLASFPNNEISDTIKSIVKSFA